MKRLLLVSCLGFLGCGSDGGSPDVPAAPPGPVQYPVKAVIDRMNLFVGSVTTKAAIPGAPAGTQAVLETVTALAARQEFNGQPATAIAGRVRGYVMGPSAPTLPPSVSESTAYYERGSNRFLGAENLDATRVRPIGAVVTPPEAAGSGASGPLQQTETHDLAMRRVAVTTWSWKLSEPGSPGAAWLCQVATVRPELGLGSTTEICALTNQAGALLGWKGSQAVPGYGTLTFTQ
jgi:hypothetical protein